MKMFFGKHNPKLLSKDVPAKILAADQNIAVL